MAGGSVTVSASKPEKLLELQKTLGISTQTPIATKTYDVITKGEATSFLTKYKAIPEGWGTVVHKTGEIDFLSPERQQLLSKVNREGKDMKQVISEVKRLEAEAIEQAGAAKKTASEVTSLVAKQGDNLAVKGSKAIAEQGGKSLAKKGTTMAAKKGASIWPGAGFVAELALKDDDTSWGVAALRGIGSEIGIGPVDVTSVVDLVSWLVSVRGDGQSGGDQLFFPGEQINLKTGEYRLRPGPKW